MTVKTMLFVSCTLLRSYTVCILDFLDFLVFLDVASNIFCLPYPECVMSVIFVTAST